VGAYKLLTTHEAADLIGGTVTARELQRRARLGDLPVGLVVRLGRRVFLNEARFIAFIESGGAPLRGPGGWRRQAPAAPAEVAAT